MTTEEVFGMLPDKKINRRQFLSVCFVALLSPLIRLVPRTSASLAGNAAWLSGAAAFLPLFGLAAFIAYLQHRKIDGTGMGNVFLDALGGVVGRFFLIVYSLWLIFYAGFILRSGADRFISTVYPDSHPLLFISVMLILSAAAALGPFHVLARTSAIIRPLLLVTLVFVFAFALPNLQTENLLPISSLDAVPILKSVIPIADVVSILSYMSFLEGKVKGPAPRARDFLWLLVLILSVSTLLCLTTIGSFGAALTQKISYPFFIMIREIRIFNILERIEALVIALWVFADYTLVSAVFHAAVENLRLVFNVPADGQSRRLLDLKNGRILIPIVCLLALLSSIFIASNEFRLSIWSDRLIPVINLAFVFVGFPIVFIIGKLRRKI